MKKYIIVAFIKNRGRVQHCTKAASEEEAMGIIQAAYEGEDLSFRQVVGTKPNKGKTIRFLSDHMGAA
jgi:hypothetical protein